MTWGPERLQEGLLIFSPHVQVPSLEGAGFVSGVGPGSGVGFHPGWGWATGPVEWLARDG